MNKDEDENRLDLQAVTEEVVQPGVSRVAMQTPAGIVRGYVHRTDGLRAVIWVAGAGGGTEGPAGGMYPRLAADLTTCEISSLRLDYRYPNRLGDCVADTKTGIRYMVSLGYSRLVLVGHSFGGAVVINAAIHSQAVVGVVTMSSQAAGTDMVAGVSPRPLLILHGQKDAVLPDSISVRLFQRAMDPKAIRLYPGCSHGLDECREEVERDVSDWIKMVLK